PGHLPAHRLPERDAAARRQCARDVPRAHRRREADPVRRADALPSRVSDIAALDGLTVPTIANAVELFGVVPPNEGFNRAPLTCPFPDFGMAVGYAVTLTAVTDRPADEIDEPEYWKWLADRPGPLLAVVQDLSAAPAGAMWGEWNANVHRTLGCVGTITQGA